jgi:peptidoglycan hydrolase-like protein with peptidoglycan-binding domain
MMCPSPKKPSMLIMAALGAMLLTGCVSRPEEAVNIAKPKSLPARNLTNFSESLRCMDELLLAFGRRDIVITSAGVPDETAAISTGTKDMLISAISRMSVKSGAFSFVDFDPNQVDVNNLQSLVGFTDDFVVPNYYIRGAITQLDEGVLDESQSAAIGITELQVGGAQDQTVSVVSLDLNVGNLLNRQIIPGISAHNSIAVARNGYAGDLAGTIESLGLVFNMSLNKGEGMHQAVRTLIELSTIEVLGKLAQVPYWRCLKIDQTNPAAVAEARGWFEDMSAKERVVFVQRALASQGQFTGAATGELDQATREAIAAYQAQNDLIADGRINFDLYASLIHQDLALGQQPDPTFGQGQPTEAAAIRPQPLTVTLSTPLGAGQTYRVNDELIVTAATSQDAYLYCYYEDGAGNVARIFPNQFQPDAYVGAGRTVTVPDGAAGFDIVLDRPGSQEKVVCLASRRELGLQLPASLKSEALVALPVGSIEEVVGAYQQLDRIDLVQARLDIAVAR